jgi:LmbE family N-acetylglucosaminyl deacetylase
MFGYKRLIKNYDRFIFLSPHLDDAVLSCGQLIIDLKKHKKDITVVTVFTKAGMKDISPQSKSFIKSCGYQNAEKLYKDFKSEDSKVLRSLNIKFTHLDFIDAAWRIDDEKKQIYKNSKSQFSGIISPKDNKLVESIKIKLEDLAIRNTRALILSPLGVGGHADHVIIRDVLKIIDYPKLFWEDFPYNTYHKVLKNFISKNLEFKRAFGISRLYFSEKEKLIKFYKSQTGSLFPSGKIKCISEKYYFEKNSKPF